MVWPFLWRCPVTTPLLEEQAGALPRPAASRVLRVIDISTPTKPQPLGEYVTAEFWAGNVAVSGSYAFVTTHDYDEMPRLFGLNLTDAANPGLVGDALDGVGGRLAAAGDYAYVVNGYAGLQIIDLSRPDRPQPTPRVPGVRGQPVLSGQYLFVAGERQEGTIWIAGLSSD